MSDDSVMKSPERRGNKNEKKNHQQFKDTSTDGIGIDDLVLGVDGDVATLVLPGLNGQKQQVELHVADLGHLKHERQEEMENSRENVALELPQGSHNFESTLCLSLAT